MTLEKGIEVSLGLFPGAGSPQRFWPMSFLWVCGSPKFEGWTSWRRYGAGVEDGHVQVTLVTPGVDTHKGGNAGALSRFISFRSGGILHNTLDYELESAGHPRGRSRALGDRT